MAHLSITEGLRRMINNLSYAFLRIGAHKIYNPWSSILLFTFSFWSVLESYGGFVVVAYTYF